MTRRTTGEDFPFRSEREWRRRERRHRAMPFSDGYPGLSSAEAGYLRASRARDLLDALHLDAFERTVAELWLAGATVRETAVLTSLPKCRVEAALRRVTRRLQAWRCGRLSSGTTGWQEVYLSEVRRRGSRKGGSNVP